MDAGRARELVAAERARIEAALHELTGDVRAEGALERQQTGETDAGSELASEMVQAALVDRLRQDLAAVERAEARLAAGTFGRSIESGEAIPDERLVAQPLAELTAEEQRRADERAR